MARAFRFPAYPKKKHQSGQARIRIRGRDYYLGAWNSEASRKEYARLAAEHAAEPQRAERLRLVANPSLTVDEVVVAWGDENNDGGKEVREILRASTVLCRLVGPTRAADFDADRLGFIRKAMIDGSWMLVREKYRRRKYRQPVGWCLSQTNHMVARLKKIWRWAELKKLVPMGAYHHLRSLSPVRKGVRVRPKVKPASEASIDAILPVLTPMVGAMLEIGRRLGLRPSELCGMRPQMFAFNGPHGTWILSLEDHKTRHVTGEDSVVLIGPEVQRIIAPWLEAARRVGHDCPIWRPAPKRTTHYTAAGFYRAIQRACDHVKVQRFTPYQLRHLLKHKVMQRHGLDAARAVLRQKSIGATNMYAAQQDIETAARVAAEMG